MRVIILVLLLTLSWTNKVRADEIQDYDYTQVDELTKEYQVEFADIAQLVVEGNFSEALRLLGEGVYNKLFSDSIVQKEIIIKILVLGIVGAVFSNIAHAFAGEGVSKTGNYIVQIALITLLAGGMRVAMSSASGLVSEVTDFIQALIPAYTVAITVGSGSVTAAAFYEIVMFVILLIDKLLLNVIFPMIQIYMLINMINFISKEAVFGKISELLGDLIKWANKSLLGLVIGLNVIKGLICPMVDSLKGTVAHKAIGLIPGVGNAINSATGVVIGSGALIKNGIGVAAMLFIMMICAFPVIKLFVFTYGCKAAAAFLEPVADKSYTSCVNGMHDGLRLLLSSVCDVMILFFLTIAMVCYAGNASFYAAN